MNGLVDCFPDFFIVGAPKCGTTALYSYLKDHPAIYMSPVKEPRLFSVELPGLNGVRSMDEYLRLFADAPAGALRGEASTTYLVSDAAVPAILQNNPGAKMIAMVRNPIDMAVSLHGYLLYMLEEDVPDFETAWRLQEARARGMRLPRGHADPMMLQYAQMCALGDQLERFLRRVPEGQALVVLYDDFVSDTRATYVSILKFLGVRDDGQQDFPRVNARKRWRFPILNELQARAFTLGRPYQLARSVAHAFGISPAALIHRYNQELTRRPSLRPAFREELIQSFEPQIDRLSRLLGRDLSHWKAPGDLSRSSRPDAAAAARTEKA